MQNGALMPQVQGQPPVRLVPTGRERLPRRRSERDADVQRARRAGRIDRSGAGPGEPDAGARDAGRGAAAAAAAAPHAAGRDAAAAARSRERPARATGPSFRGDGSAGNGDGQRAVTEWDVASGKNIKWKTPIPGVANSSPIVWGNRVFATTAISKAGDNSFKTGLYGDVKPVDDLSPHEWKIYCLDKATGKILWERTAVTGAPKTKRHTKSSQASSTPVTDGRASLPCSGPPAC